MSEDNQNKPIPEEKPQTNHISVKRSTYNKLIVGIVLSLIAVSFFGGYVIGGQETKNVVQTIQTIPQTNPQPTQPSKVFVTLGDSPVEGNKNAPVTIVEFSDFQCPFCGAFYLQTLPQIQKDYIDSGKVKLVYRDFPLENIHQNAKAASLAAQCANEQGKFWEYHNTLFSSQRDWATLDAINATNAFEQFAVDLKLDSNNFNSCMDSEKYLDKVNKNAQDGMTFRVSGTPTFFIGDDKNGYIQLVGAQPYSVFKQEIDAQLR
jgi:protein-disulfide isomerase